MGFFGSNVPRRTANHIQSLITPPSQHPSTVQYSSTSVPWCAVAPTLSLHHQDPANPARYRSVPSRLRRSCYQSTPRVPPSVLIGSPAPSPKSLLRPASPPVATRSTTRRPRRKARTVLASRLVRIETQTSTRRHCKSAREATAAPLLFLRDSNSPSSSAPQRAHEHRRRDDTLSRSENICWRAALDSHAAGRYHRQLLLLSLRQSHSFGAPPMSTHWPSCLTTTSTTLPSLPTRCEGCGRPPSNSSSINAAMAVAP